MHDLEVTIDEARSVVERVASIKGEEFLFDGDSRIACRRDRIKQVECTAEFTVKNRSRQVVAGLRVAAQKETAAHRLIGLVDRDVRAGHSGVADQICGRRESAEPAADDMRLHPLLSGLPGLEGLP